jgi:hypothetical protein
MDYQEGFRKLRRLGALLEDHNVITSERYEEVHGRMALKSP